MALGYLLLLVFEHSIVKHFFLIEKLRFEVVKAKPQNGSFRLSIHTTHEALRLTLITQEIDWARSG